jgi:protein-disulfide isomerase/uncharacterized membrane protein
MSNAAAVAPTPAPPASPAPTKPRPRILSNLMRLMICVLALGGWWVSLDLFRLAAGGQASLVILQQTCGGESAAAGDCASVLRSQYGSIQLGANGPRVPAGAFGMAYFAAIIIWFLFAGIPTSHYRWRHLPIVLLIAFGVLQSLTYIHVMAEVLRQWCPGCVAVHVMNFAIAALAILSFPWRRERTPRPPRPILGQWVASGGLAASVGLIHILLTLLLMGNAQQNQIAQRYTALIEDPAFVQWKYAQQPAVALPARDGLVSKGPADAPHRVVIFSDFQCPACRRAHYKLDELLERYPDRLSVTYRHLPQNSDCNPAYDTQAHAAACAAARAVEAARLVGGDEEYLGMQALLFGRQEELAGADFTTYAVQRELDRAAFAAALIDARVDQAIRADVALVNELGNPAPPAIYLNGRRLEYWTSDAAWGELLSAE